MRLCSDCDRLIYLVSIFYIFVPSNSCMFSFAVYCFGQVVGSDSKRERCARLWVHASLMTRLSDRNMSLGVVLLPKGENNGACDRGHKDCLLYAKFFYFSCLLLWVYTLGGARNIIPARCSI